MNDKDRGSKGVRGEVPDTGAMETKPRSAKPDENWAREALLGLAFSSLREQRRTRLWNIFFRLAYIFLAFFFLYILSLSMHDRARGGQPLIAGSGDHAALIDIAGLIASDGDTRAREIIPALRRAFENKEAVGIVLRINSPGGSPVESGRINDEIVRLRSKYPDKKIYASISDLCASGAYYVAVAAEQIHANEASLIGSIGVISASFGFTEALSKMGIERRLMMAGEDKDLLDPFLPLNPNQVEHIQGILDTVHRQFIDTVIEGRGDQLRAPEEELFSGLVWTGEQAVSLGLIDGLIDTNAIVRDLLKVEDVVDYTPQPIESLILKWLDRVSAALYNSFYKMQTLRIVL